jgi:hypothetical protein
MKFVALAFVGCLLVPGTSSAVCAIDPLAPELEAAEVVYVGTVVSSKLADSLKAKAPHGVTLVHAIEPQITLKGAPAGLTSVTSIWQYNDPRSRTHTEHAELVPVLPGDTLLIVGNVGQAVQVGACTASRVWGPETKAVVANVFRPAP